jgi:hypothetical protein
LDLHTNVGLDAVEECCLHYGCAASANLLMLASVRYQVGVGCLQYSHAHGKNNTYFLARLHLEIPEKSPGEKCKC